MSKTIRKILGEAYEFLGLAPNGILHDGQVSEGVNFANEVIKKYNESSLFPFTYSTLEMNVSGGSAVISSQPEPGENLGVVPVGVAAVYWKKSETDLIDLEKMDFKDIFRMRNTSSSPEYYSLVVESDDRATFSFDALGSFKVFLVYPHAIPRLDIDGTFNAPEIYDQVVKYGVVVRAAIKRSLEPSVIEDYKKLLDEAVSAVTGSNASKRPVKRNFGRAYRKHDEFVCPRNWR